MKRLVWLFMGFSACTVSDGAASRGGLSPVEAHELVERSLAQDVASVNVRSEQVIFAEGLQRWGVQAVYRDGNADYGFVVDETGQRFSTEEFWRQERKARRLKFGRLTSDLFSQLPSLARTDESIVVELQIAANVPVPMIPGGPTERRATIDEFDAWTRAHADAVVVAIRPAKDPVIKELMQRRVEIMENPSGLPTVVVRLKPTEIAAGLLDIDGVESIALPGLSPDHLNGDYAGHQSMNYSPPSGYLAGGPNCVGSCDGGLFTMGIWEYDITYVNNPIVGGIARNNSRLANYTATDAVAYEVAPTPCINDATCNPSTNSNQHVCRTPIGGTSSICVQAHLSTVAAAIGTNGAYAYNSTIPGGADYMRNVPTGTSFDSSGAYRVRYRVANGTNVDNSLSFLAAPAGGLPPALYVNRSANGVADRVDWVSRTYGTFFTLAGGNSGPASNVDCGVARNVLCVGWYEYRTYNSIGTHQISSESNSKNQAATPLLERPHLLGPGTHTPLSGLHVPYISTSTGTNNMSWALDSGNAVKGSSFAAPAVLGLALQAHQYEGFLSALAFPVVNKAVIMASTQSILNGAGVHDGLIGLSNVWFPQPADALDGGGQPNAAHIRQILDGNQYFTTDLTNASFVSCGTNCRELIVGTVTVPVGQSLRAALVWQSCPVNPGGVPTIINDLDLLVTSSGGVFSPCTTAISSASVDSELEMIETSACSLPNPKTYTLRVRIKNGATLQTCPGFPAFERIGVAWSKRVP